MYHHYHGILSVPRENRCTKVNKSATPRGGGWSFTGMSHANANTGTKSHNPPPPQKTPKNIENTPQNAFTKTHRERHREKVMMMVRVCVNVRDGKSGNSKGRVMCDKRDERVCDHLTARRKVSVHPLQPPHPHPHLHPQ